MLMFVKHAEHVCYSVQHIKLTKRVLMLALFY